MELREWEKLVKTPTKSILSLHTKPDGDSIGSNLALLRILQKYGHQVTIITRDQAPPLFSFLPYFEKIQQVRTSEIHWNDYGIFWALDMSSPSMLDEQFKPANIPIAVIDHHTSNPGWGTYNFIEPDAASTTQVLYKLFTQLQIGIDSKTAMCLYAGLMTDTVFMKYVDMPEPFHVAAQLIELGADPSEIRFRIGQQIVLEELQASADILSRTERIGSFVVFAYANDIVSKYKLIAPPDFVVDYASQIAGTDFGLVMFESEPNTWRLEFRAHKAGFDVSEIAKKLGGGGHVAAAGVRKMLGQKDGVLNKVIEASASA